jgi:hypothetical protein
MKRLCRIVAIAGLLWVYSPAAARQTNNCPAASAEFGPNAPTIRIVWPEDEGIVFGSTLTVNVDTSGFDLKAEGNHWELNAQSLWDNSQIQQIVYGNYATIVVQPGRYQLCVLLKDANNVTVGAFTSKVIVNAADSGTPTTIAPLAPGVVSMQQIETQNTIRNIFLLVVGGGAAAIAGWWVGKRLPKRR